MKRRRLSTVLCSLSIVLLAGSASRASDIHRVVTGFAAGDKSTALFDSRLSLEVGKSGTAGAVLWTTDSYPLGFSQQDTAQRPVGIQPPANFTASSTVGATTSSRYLMSSSWAPARDPTTRRTP